MGGTRQNTSLTEQPASAGVRVKVDAAETAAVNVRNSIMLGQPLIEEGVFSAQQFGNAAILAHDAVKEQFRFLAERLPEIVVKVGEQAHIRSSGSHIAQIQPLLREIFDQGPRTFIPQHTAPLLFEPRRGSELS